jgi:hypothetical protein
VSRPSTEAHPQQTKPCPSCGYCPCCGRGPSTVTPYPYGRWPYTPTPWWETPVVYSGNQCGTTMLQTLNSTSLVPADA